MTRNSSSAAKSSHSLVPSSNVPPMPQTVETQSCSCLVSLWCSIVVLMGPRGMSLASESIHPIFLAGFSPHQPRRFSFFSSLLGECNNQNRSCLFSPLSKSCPLGPTPRRLHTVLECHGNEVKSVKDLLPSFFFPILESGRMVGELSSSKLHQKERRLFIRRLRLAQPFPEA